MNTIHRTELRKLIDDDAPVIEVLPKEEYDLEHISGAINIPLKSLNAEAVSRLDKAGPVVTYCNGFT
jgi:rhodanese-related sulfurtransferase